MLSATLALAFYADHNLRQFSYDVLILLILTINVVMGFHQGLIRRSIGLAAVFGGSAAATWVGNSMVNAFSHNGLVPNTCTFVGIIVLVIGMIELLSFLYRGQIQHTSSLVFDRTAGTIMGLVVGILEVGLLVVVALAVGEAQPPAGHDPAGQRQLAADVRTATLGSLFAQSDNGLRSVFTPVLPTDLPSHLSVAAN